MSASTNPRTELELSFIHALTKKALEMRTLGELWPVLEASLVGFFGCDRATLFLVEGPELRSMFAKGLDSPVVVKLGDGLAGNVGLTGKTALVNEADSDPRFNPAFDRVTGYRTVNLACAAFLHERKVVGVVELLNKPGGFAEEDARSLDWFSPHIGFIIAKLQSEESNRELEGALAHASRMAALGTMVSGAARELSAPLASLGTAVDRLIGMVPAGSELREELDRVSTEVLRCQGHARSLLDCAHHSDFVLEPVSAPVELATILFMVGHRARLHKVTVHVEFPQDLPEVRAAPRQLQEVFLNVVTNALQAMPLGGTLKIQGEVADGSVEIRFHDDGEGIDPSDLQRVCEPFFTTRPGAPGKGMGLAIAKDLVEKFGGKLSARSEGKGLGATVTLRLQLAKRVRGEG